MEGLLSTGPSRSTFVIYRQSLRHLNCMYTRHSQDCEQIIPFDSPASALLFLSVFSHFSPILHFPAPSSQLQKLSVISSQTCHFKPFPANSSQFQQFTAIFRNIRKFHKFPSFSSHFQLFPAFCSNFQPFLTNPATISLKFV